MNSQDSEDKEQKLRERELSLQLRELELHAKLNDPAPTLETVEKSKRSIKTGMREFIKWAKIIGCFCVGLLLVYLGALLAVWVAVTFMIGTLCYLGYLLFGPKTHSRPY